MITVREKLMSQALTDADRDLLSIWFEEKADSYCARQRAWEQVSQRTRHGLPDLRVSW